MQKIFEKILEMLEDFKHWEDDSGRPIHTFSEVQRISKCKEIVQEVAKEYNNGWIPCEKGLPDENIEVDVTIKEIDGSTYTQTSWLQEGQWVVKKSPLQPKVIAWKERPEPYQPGGE